LGVLMRPTATEIRFAYDHAKQLLLKQCVSINGQPAHWSGELSTSALSTATAMMALLQVRKADRSASDFGFDADFDRLIEGGAKWLLAQQNEDGGWGDTTKSISNISTTMLCHAVLVECEHRLSLRESTLLVAWTSSPCAIPRKEHGLEAHATKKSIACAKKYIDDAGGVEAVRKRYGKDKTFSVPILTHCALAGLVDWREVSSLPFELACLPAKFYAAVKLPVVSYALPALIAIGQVKHHFAPSWNPLVRWLRNRAISKSLAVLARIQPPNGGFLEATPLTSFVTMSLAAKGLVDHVVVKRGVKFICDSVRPDGSWPIDTNLATWVTTLAINALKDDVPESLRPDLRQWLLSQQYREVHPFTNAAPGGWAWTDLPGGVPDADDTPGAMLALKMISDVTAGSLRRYRNSLQCESEDAEIRDSLSAGGRWLIGLQNRDGGFPTFCRGWGTLPFDRSSPDITAHCIRSIVACVEGFGHLVPVLSNGGDLEIRWALPPRVTIAGRLPHCEIAVVQKGFRFLSQRQRRDGAWLPLWFGNQRAHDDENPTYGTSRVLMAYRDCELLETTEAQRGAAFLANIQNEDGGWGGAAGIASSVEETALAAEVLLDFKKYRSQAFDGIGWLINRWNSGSLTEPSPIGFYFAKLWYFERLYPLVFAVSALRRAVEVSGLDEMPS